MARPRKEPEEEPRKSKIISNDAVITVSFETKEGTETRMYRIPGFLGNTLAWQRSGKGLDDIIVPALQNAFGGQVRVE